MRLPHQERTMHLATLIGNADIGYGTISFFKGVREMVLFIGQLSVHIKGLKAAWCFQLLQTIQR